jgi:hypothetical protein
MSLKSNTLFGAAAVCLAVLFPIYWIYAFAAFFSSDSAEFMSGDFFKLTGWDGLFVIIGFLEIMVYVGLYRLCREQLNGGVTAILLLIMAAIIALFHSSVIIDILLVTGAVTTEAESLISWGVVISLSLLFLYAIVALLFSVALLLRCSELTTIMKVFAFGLLLACIFQLTFVFMAVNIVLFPLLMILVAIQFFRNDHSVEIV